MYISIRDFGAREVARALGDEMQMAKGLNYLGIGAVELEYFFDDRAYLLEPEGRQDKVDIRSSEGRETLKGQLSKYDINISSLLMHNDFGDADRGRQIEWILRCLEAAEYFKVRVIRIDTVITTQHEVSVEEAAWMSTQALKEVFSQIPANKKIYLALENHGKHGNDPEFLRRVLAGVNDERLGLTLDSGNFYWFGFPLEQVYDVFEEFAPLTRHTHIKNIKYPEDIRTISREPGYRYNDYVSPVYEGDIDHQRFVEILKKAGYAEDLCLEDESLEKYLPAERLEIMKKDIEHLKSLLL